MIIDFFVSGIPKPQKRPRTFMLKGRPVTWSPKDKTWSEAIYLTTMQRITDMTLPIHGPVQMILGFVLPRPSSRPKRFKYPDKRPDVENLAKSVMDVLTGIVYRDDAQIVDLHVSKEYGDRSGVRVVVKEIEI